MMRLGSLRHPFSDTVADIDGVSVRTRLAGNASGSGTAGRRGFTDVPPSTTSSTAAQSSDEKLPLRGFDIDQAGSSSAAVSRSWSQRHRLASSRSTAADLPQSAAVVETPSPSALTRLHSAAEPPPPPRPLCVIDCCCCCAGSILISWLKVSSHYSTFSTFKCKLFDCFYYLATVVTSTTTPRNKMNSTFLFCR